MFKPIEKIKTIEVNTTDLPTKVKQVIEKQREESTSKSKSTFGPIRASARISAKNSRIFDTDSLVNDMNERQLGNLWLNNIILTKEDLLDEEDTEDYEDDIPSNPIEEFLNNNPTNWDEQTKEEKVKAEPRCLSHPDEARDKSHEPKSFKIPTMPSFSCGKLYQISKRM